jgi:hypothetical protein
MSAIHGAREGGEIMPFDRARFIQYSCAAKKNRFSVGAARRRQSLVPVPGFPPCSPGVNEELKAA